MNGPYDIYEFKFWIISFLGHSYQNNFNNDKLNVIVYCARPIGIKQNLFISPNSIAFFQQITNTIQ